MIIKVRLAHFSNIIDKELFVKIFGYEPEALANKLINITNKEENQIIVNDIKKNRDILYEKDNFNNWMVQPNTQRVDLIDADKLVLNFNEKIQLDDDFRK